MKRLFEYAVIKAEKRDKDDEVIEEAVLLVPPTHVLAEDDAQVGITAARAIPEEHTADLGRIQVVVRPF